MEKNTFGKFLSALRKANGMTQKDLADKLNVSDKAVSRWERDENYPDLSLIPVIADIFNVTTDELLRGAKNPVTEDNEPQTPNPADKKKSEKQIKNLIKRQASKWYKLVAITGAIMACCILLYTMLYVTGCNRTFTVIVGFLAIVSAVAFLASPIIGNIRFNNYIYDFEDCPEEVPQYKKKFFRITWTIESLLALVLTMIISVFYSKYICDYESIAGWSDVSWLLTWPIFFGISEMLALLILQIVRKNKKGIVFAIAEALLLILLIFQFSLTDSDIAMAKFTKSTTFTDFDEFKNYVGAKGSAEKYDEVKAYIPLSWDIYDYEDTIHGSVIDNHYKICHLYSGETYNIKETDEAADQIFHLNNPDICLIRIEANGSGLTFHIYDFESISAVRVIFCRILLIMSAITLLAAIALPVVVLVRLAANRQKNS